MTPAEMLVARWRGNGGWFWNLNQFTLPKPIRSSETAELANFGKFWRTPSRARLSQCGREVVGLVTPVRPSSFPRFLREPVAIVDWWSARLRLILKPVPNVSAGKGDSPSRPTWCFLVKDNG